MSTTVSYKGATIATVSNNTKTLLTEGKYLEDDLTLVDVSGGGAVLTTKSISANGTYNASSDSADGYSQVNVAVPASAVDTGTKNITANGSNQDVVGYAAVDVAVPNSYSASDEGKVVDNGALVAQTSDTVTENDTYDTTLINSLTVNVSGGGGYTLAEIASGSKPSGVVDITGVTFSRGYAFYAQNSITKVIGTPIISSGIHYEFAACTGIQAVHVLNVPASSGAQNMFQGCTGITTAVFGTTEDGLIGIFNGANHLTVCDYTATRIRTNCFYGNSALKTLILRSTSVVTLENVGAITTNTPFKSGGTGGTIYIPKSLYDHLGDGGSNDYKAASNWSTVDGYGTITWAKIEGSQYEGYYADGEVIS